MNTTEKKKDLGLDFDDVVMDFNEHLHVFYNRRHNASIRRSDIVHYELHKIWKCTPEQVDERLLEFYSTEEHALASPVNGVKEALRKLKAKYNIHIITSRGDQIKDITTKWIRRHLPRTFSSVNLTNQIFGPAEKKRSKSEFCKELGIQVMVEDSLSQARELAKNIEKVILLDCPWNQGELPPNVQRVHSWQEIEKALL